MVPKEPFLQNVLIWFVPKKEILVYLGSLLFSKEMKVGYSVWMTRFTSRDELRFNAFYPVIINIFFICFIYFIFLGISCFSKKRYLFLAWSVVLFVDCVLGNGRNYGD